MTSGNAVRVGQSRQDDARLAVREFHAAVAQPDMALVVFFCASTYDLPALAHELNLLFQGVPVIGCTTAGEIGPEGYTEHSLCGISFAAGAFDVTTGHLDQLKAFDITQGQAFARAQLQAQQSTQAHLRAHNTFALLLIDGLSVREEPVTRALQNALNGIPLIGGSAGDGSSFQQTHVFCDGRFGADRAAMALLTTPLPFQPFKIQHFTPTDVRLVVTAADISRRIVMEINGRPAVEEYARAIGVPVETLSADHFAASPLLVLISGAAYVRSIQKANPDGSLTFFCAIEEGLVLRIAQGGDVVNDMAQSFTHIREAIGEPQVMIGFDCFLRRLEITQKSCTSEIEDLLKQNHVVGFNTYGEQFCGVHITQTLTGVAIGAPRA